MNATEYREHLISLGACPEALAWSDGMTAEEAWRKCERGDWMIWYAVMLSGKAGSDGRRKPVRCACECARLSLPHVREGEDLPREAIELAERWAEGDGGVSINDLCDAAEAANAAAHAANAAAHAAYAAAYAASEASYAAAEAADEADAAVANCDLLGECADIVRKHYPTNPVLNATKD